MFKYSHRFLEKLAGEKIDYLDFDRNWLDLQGFEVASEEVCGDDAIVELEVKANRPDMLSHLGVLREYYVYKGYKREPNIKSKVNIDNLKSLPIEVEVNTDDVGNLVLVCIKNIDNTKKTPDNIVKLLNNLGVASVNPIVDLSNFVMLELGQPIHIYDLDKLNAKLEFTNSKVGEKITTLNGSQVDVPNGSIIINDKDGAVCLAGVIGTQKVEIDHNTKNIIIESANFDAVKLRIASQQTHISTLASYRYERGVDANITKLGACLCAQYIMDACGGELDSAYVRFNNSEDNVKVVKVSNVNKLLGTKLNVNDIKKLLEDYYYRIEIIDDDTFKAICPSYRLDIEQEVDVIGDIAQMYGYHNIEPTMPNLSVEYQPNYNIINSDIIRNLMYSQNINECISYSFIHENAMKMLNISEGNELYGDIRLINPLSNKFAVMRPNMLYSMLNTLIYNYSKEGTCDPIFEIGTVFKVDKSADTGYSQNSHLAVVLCGNKITKGFGVDKDVPYDFYDIKQILELIGQEYSFDIKLVKGENSAFALYAKVFINNVASGYIGIVDSKILKNFENGKLVKDKIYYLEINIDNLTMGVTPLGKQSKYPSIIREYNLLVKDGIEYQSIANLIKEQSQFIIGIQVKDIYRGKGVDKGYTALLLEIEYNDYNETLTSQQVEDIEKSWLNKLQSKFGVTLKA